MRMALLELKDIKNTMAYIPTIIMKCALVITVANIQVKELDSGFKGI